MLPISCLKAAHRMLIMIQEFVNIIGKGDDTSEVIVIGNFKILRMLS